MSKAPAGPAGVLRSAFRQLLAGSPRNPVRLQGPQQASERRKGISYEQGTVTFGYSS